MVALARQNNMDEMRNCVLNTFHEFHRPTILFGRLMSRLNKGQAQELKGPFRPLYVVVFNSWGSCGLHQ